MWDTADAACLAPAWWYFAPSRLRTSERWFFAVLSAAYDGLVPSGNSTSRRMKSTTMYGNSSSFGNRRMR